MRDLKGGVERLREASIELVHLQARLEGSILRQDVALQGLAHDEGEAHLV